MRVGVDRRVIILTGRCAEISSRTTPGKIDGTVSH